MVIVIIFPVILETVISVIILSIRGLGGEDKYTICLCIAAVNAKSLVFIYGSA